MSTHSIPIVDLSEFLAGGEKKQKFVHELGKAFEEIGFVSVRNHGVPQQLIDDYYSAIQQFFALPTEVKRGKYEKPELAGQIGRAHV